MKCPFYKERHIEDGTWVIDEDTRRDDCPFKNVVCDQSKPNCWLTPKAEAQTTVEHKAAVDNEEKSQPLRFGWDSLFKFVVGFVVGSAAFTVLWAALGR